MGLNAFKSALILRASEAFRKVSRALSQPVHVDSGKLRKRGLPGLISGFVVLVILVPMVGSISETFDEWQSTMLRVQKAKGILAQKESLQDLKKEISKVHQSDGTYLPTEASAIASANLQSRIKQMLGESGAELASLQVLPDRKEDQFDRVGIKVRFNSDTRALRHVLYNIENNQPYLFLDYLSVRAIRGAAGPKSQPDAEKLNVEVDVVGYMRPQ